MADKNKPESGDQGSTECRQLNEGYVPLKKGWQPTGRVQGGYQPPTSEGGSPPTGGGGGKEPETSKKD